MNDIWQIVSKFATKFVIEYSMNRVFQCFGALFVACLSLTSCMHDETEVTTYDDMSISSFKLGTLKRYLHTTSSKGMDSVYANTYSAGTYRIAIDQLQHRISNMDSLLPGTDLKHVVCTVTAKNGGMVYLKSIASDTLYYFASGTDSVDFSQPRVFRVFATDGSGSRDYTVTLRARSQAAGVLRWTTADKGDFPHIDGLSLNGLQEVADDAEMLPDPVLGCASWLSATRTDYTLVVGKNKQSEKALVLWRKLTDTTGKGQWTYMPLADDNPYYLPVMNAVSLVYLEGSILAFGSNGKIYQSRDQGITWKQNPAYTFPSDFNTTDFCAAAEQNGMLWLQDMASGKTWKGRLTK